LYHPKNSLGGMYASTHVRHKYCSILDALAIRLTAKPEQIEIEIQYRWNLAPLKKTWGCVLNKDVTGIPFCF